MKEKIKIIMLYVFCYSLLIIISIVFYFAFLKVDEMSASLIPLIPIFGLFLFGGMFNSLGYEKDKYKLEL